MRIIKNRITKLSELIIRVLNNARYSILCVNAVENIFTENIIKVTSSLELKLSFPTFISE